MRRLVRNHLICFYTICTGICFEKVNNQQHKELFEPAHDKTNKMACAPSEDSDQPGHPPSLIAKDPSFLHAECEDSNQTDLSSLDTRHFVGFVMRWLI